MKDIDPFKKKRYSIPFPAKPKCQVISGNVTKGIPWTLNRASDIRQEQKKSDTIDIYLPCTGCSTKYNAQGELSFKVQSD